MSKITKNPLPAPLRPEDIQNRELVVCHVKDTLVDVPSPSTRRAKATVMLLWEFEGKGLYLNEGSKDAAVAGFLSDETNDWKDKEVPVIRVRSTFKDNETGREVSGWKLWIAPAEQWPTLFKQWRALPAEQRQIGTSTMPAKAKAAR